MKINHHYLLSGLTAVVMNISTVAQAEEPSRLFLLEKASVASAGTVSFDLGYDASQGAGSNTGIRIGIANGEIQINRSDFDTGIPAMTGYSTTIGYKTLLMQDLALYGEFGMIDREVNDIETDDATSIAVGAAYTMQPAEGFMVSFNAEFVSLDDDSLAEDTFIKLGAGAQYALNLTQIGKVYLVGEVITDDSSETDPSLLLGARWAVNDRITLDFNVIENSGDTRKTTAIPGSIKINLVF